MAKKDEFEDEPESEEEEEDESDESEEEDDESDGSSSVSSHIGGEGDMNDDDDEDDDDDDDDDNDNDDEDNVVKNIFAKPVTEQITIDEVEIKGDDDDEDEEDDDAPEQYRRFEDGLRESIIMKNHSHLLIPNTDEVEKLSKVVRNDRGQICDPLHKTVPFLTKYELARVLGERTNQLQMGGEAFVKVPEHVINEYQIARLELEQKAIPFVIRRPLPDGSYEYWSLSDLEILIPLA